MLTDQERKNVIATIVEREPNPDQSLCPTLMIYYPKVVNKEKVYITKNVNTGEVDESPKYLTARKEYGRTYVRIDWQKVRQNNIIMRSPCKFIEAEYAKVHKLKDNEYDRLGLEENYTEFLGNKVVCHSIPIRPGRNLAIIVESAAVNHRQKKMGYNAAQELYNRVQRNLMKNEDDE